jgi:hypothetical protein
MRFARLLAIPLLVCTCVFLSTSTAYGTGELTLSLGGAWPQASLAEYSDPGFTVLARAGLELPKFRALSGWIGVGFVNFGGDSFETDTSEWGVVEQSTNQHAFTMHIGAQLGAEIHERGEVFFFRPRAAVGVGYYFFRSTLSLERIDAEPDEDPLQYETLDSQSRFGWRGVVGLDCFVTQRWGVSIDVFYDHVFELNRVEGDEESRGASTYQGVALGVVFRLGADESTSQ